MRKFFLAAFAALAIAPAFAQSPSPVPALPDAERRTTYTISGTTCACAVGFHLYGDGTDFNNWVEVFINGIRYDYNDASHGWTITSSSGSLGSIARPITNAVLTFNAVQTGTVQIVGARKPRRVSQFNENAGVSARNLNQVITDMVATQREIWDKTNDMTGRGIFAPPGETLNLLSAASLRANSTLGFDALGQIYYYTPSSAVTSAANINFLQSGTGAASVTLDTILRAKVITPEMFKASATCDGTDDGPAIQRAVTYAGSLAAKPTVKLSCSYTVNTGIVDPVGINLVCENMFGPAINFQPASNNQIAYRVRNAGNVVSGGSIRNCGFYTFDTTNTKTAIEVEDVSNYTIEDVTVRGSTTSGGTNYWGGGGNSIGLSLKGREFIRVNRFTSFAERPMVVADNPNSTKDSDWLDARNLNLTTYGNLKNFEINDGVNFTHMSIDGISCVKGAYCLYNNDTTASQISQGLAIRSMGNEQSTASVAANSGNIWIKRPASGILYELTLDGSSIFDPARNGVVLRNVIGADIDGVQFESSASYSCFDVSNTVFGLNWNASVWRGCSSAMSGQTLTVSGITQSGYSLPRWARYTSTADDATITSASYGVLGSVSNLTYLRAQASPAGNVVLLPSNAGTLVGTASAPLSIDPVTGNATCATCTINGITSLTGDVTATGPGAAAATLVTAQPGAHTWALGQTFSSAITYGSVTLSNSVTGTGSMALSANPTFTGTVNVAGLQSSGTTNFGGLTASTALALDGSKNLVSVTNTGSGNNVLATSPTLTTPNLGTPSAVTLTNGTGLPTTGLTGTLQAAQEPAHTGDVTNSAGSLALTIAANAVTDVKFRQGVARSVVGVTGNATANTADIQGATDQVLRVNGAGTALAFGAIDLSKAAAATGVLQAASFPALTGDCTTSAGALATTCTKINGVDQTTAWTTFTPTLTCGTGTFTVNSARWKNMGKTVWFSIDFSVTATGTCGTGPVTFTLPATVQSGAGFAGREKSATGKLAGGSLLPGTTTAEVSMADVTAIPAAGRFYLSGVYESQ